MKVEDERNPRPYYNDMYLVQAKRTVIQVKSKNKKMQEHGKKNINMHVKMSVNSSTFLLFPVDIRPRDAI